jgi:Trk K+ transport system NAD-binding subunit
MSNSAIKPQHRQQPTHARRYSLARLFWANFYDLRLLIRESRFVLAAFVALALVGTLYLFFVYPGSDKPHNLVEALYETLKLLTLQSGLRMPGDALGQTLFFLIPLLGLALIFQSVLNFGRLLLDKNSRREAWQVALASTYRDHIIVCGLGRVGLRVVSKLIAGGYEVVVVERDWNSEFVERALRLKAPVVLGDAREPAILQQAGLMRARAVVAAINDDLLNIEIALTARNKRADIRVVLRVFNEELDFNLERTFGAHTAFSTSALAAPTFAAAAVSREVDYVLPFGDELLGVSQIEIAPGSEISTYVHAVERNHNIRILVHQDTTGRILKRKMMRQLNSGDQVMVLGSLQALESLRVQNVQGSKYRFLDDLPLQRPNAQFNTVIVCGLGRVSYQTLHRLHRIRPRPRIVVVHQDDKYPEFVKEISRLDDVTMIVGDAREANVLLDAGLNDAYSVLAVTSDDVINLQIGLNARRHRPDIHVVLRVFSDTLADKLADIFGIRTAYSTSGLAGPTLAAAAVIGDVTQAFFAGDRLYAADEITLDIGDTFTGQTVERVCETRQVLVIGLRRDGKRRALPSLDEQLLPGDTITLLAPIETLTEMRAAFTRHTNAAPTQNEAPAHPDLIVAATEAADHVEPQSYATIEQGKLHAQERDDERN